MSVFDGGTKSQIERVYAILEQVRANRFPNCRKLSEQLEFSQKTIQRDITFMKDRLELPISYNRSQHGYELTEEVVDFPEFHVQVEDLAALFITRQALEGIEETQLAKALSPAFAKITRQLEGEVDMNWNAIDEAFSIKKLGVVEADLTVFGKLAEAVLKRREVSFLYRRVGGKKSGRRKLQPYHVGKIGGGWYVIGYDHLRQSVRTFALQRIKGLSLLKSTFDRPESFKIEQVLGKTLGVWYSADEDLTEVVIEVKGPTARIVQERFWHPSQEIRLLDDMGERVELRMNLNHLEEVKSLVLSWGSNAKVIAPDELRDAVKNEAASMVRSYRK